MSEKKFGSKENVYKPFRVRKNFGSEIFVKKNLDPKMLLYLKKVLGLKQCWVRIKFGYKNFGSKKMLGPKKILSQKIIWVGWA